MGTVPIGTVAQVWCFPVKSLAGLSVEAAVLDAGGVAGDRAWVVWDPVRDAPLTAAARPELHAVGAVPGHDGPMVVLPGQGGPRADAAAALSAYVGQPVTLRPAAPGRRWVDVAPVHLVSRQGIARSRSDAHLAACACSVEEPRANLVLDLPDTDERQLIGQPLHVGSARLLVDRLPDHCLGVYATVTGPGPVRVGDPVRLPA